MTLRDIGVWFDTIASNVRSDIKLILDGASLLDWPLYILIPAGIIGFFLAGLAAVLLSDLLRKNYDTSTMTPRTKMGLIGAQIFVVLFWVFRTLMLWLLILCLLGMPLLGILSRGPDAGTMTILLILLAVSLLLAIILPLKPWRWRKAR